MKQAFNVIREIYRGYPAYLVVFLCAAVITSLIEAVGLSTILPVIASTLQGGAVNVDGKLSEIYEFLGIGSLKVEEILFVVFFVFIFRAIIKHGINMLTAHLAIKIEVDMRRQLVARLFDSKWAFFQSISTGSFINVLNKEAMNVLQVNLYFCRLITGVTEAIILFIISLYVSVEMVAIGVVLGLLYLYLMKSFVKITYNLRKIWLKIDNEINGVVIENIIGAKVIRGMNLKSVRINYFDDLLKSSVAPRLGVERYKSLMSVTQDPFVLLIIAVAIYSITNGVSNSQDDALIGLLLLYRVSGRVMTFQKSIQAIAGSMPSSQAVIDYLRLAKENKDNVGNTKIKEFREAVFNQVCFSYDGSKKKTLKNISLSIKNNEMVAFVGSSGGGKTTLMDIFLGLLEPSSGSLSINGVVYSDIDFECWRGSIGFVSQDSYLFEGSVFENIAVTKKGATKAEVTAAAKLARADDFISSMPNGYNTQVGDLGVKLSGGQKQRIALARALLRRPKILVLDEATSALDAESESQIRNALLNLKKQMAIVIVAHRFMTIKEADSIHVLDDGVIIQSGNYETLLKDKGGLFNHLNRHYIGNDL